MVNPEPEGLGQTKKYNGLEVTILKMGWEGGVSHPESMVRHPQQLIYIYMTIVQ